MLTSGIGEVPADHRGTPALVFKQSGDKRVRKTGILVPHCCKSFSHLSMSMLSVPCCCLLPLTGTSLRA